MKIDDDAREISGAIRYAASCLLRCHKLERFDVNGEGNMPFVMDEHGQNKEKTCNICR